MRTRFETLLVGSLLVLTVQQVTAELPPVINFDAQFPEWNTGQLPIAWGDCIPVPVLPMNAPPIPNYIPVVPMGPPPLHALAPFPGNMPMPMMAPSDAPFLLPPPSPYFNNPVAPIPAIPAAPIQAECDNSSKNKLERLQSRYNLAAAASKSKIEELKQALEDTHNQMTDASEAIDTLVKKGESEKAETLSLAQEDAKNQMSDARAIIEELAKEQEVDKAEVIRLKGLLGSHESNRVNLHKELNVAKQSMLEQLEKLRLANSLANEKNLKAKAKILRLEALQNSQESNRLSLHKELNVAKQSMLEQLEKLRLANSLANEKNLKAKAKILRLEALQNSQESNRLSLHNELDAAKNKTSEQITNQNTLNKLSAEIAALKDSYEDQGNENSMLKGLEVALNQKLSDLDTNNKSQKEKITLAAKNAVQQSRKLAALSQSTQELGALKALYKERNNENLELKKKLMGVEGKQSNLNSKLDSLQTASTLKGEQDRNTIDGLREQLASLENAHKSLKTKLMSVETNAGAQARKLTVLGQSTAKLTALQSAYKARNDESIQLKKELGKLESLQTASTLKGAQDKDIINGLKKKLAGLNDANISLKTKLSSVESNAGAQARKLTALGQSAAELPALQSAYKERNNENIDLKKKLESLNNANISLKTKLSSAETNGASQTRKLTVLGQSVAELMSLQSAYKARNDENIELKKALVKVESLQAASTLKGGQDQEIINGLKKKLTGLNDANISLKTKLSSVESNAGSQAKKLTALGQTAAELPALKSAYKERNDENIELKKKLENLNNANISLKTKLTSVETNASTQARKLTALGKSAAELPALQSAYKARNDENVTLKNKLAKLGSLQTACTLKGAQDQSIVDGLKKKLASLGGVNKSLKTKLSSAEANAGTQARKLTALSQSTTKLTALQSAYDERNNEAVALKNKLAELKISLDIANVCHSEASALKNELAASDDKNKSILAKISSLESTASSQVNTLSANAKELSALKSAYDELNTKKADLSSKLTAAQADTDKDGVLDSTDKCPDSLEGVEVNATGCFADVDKDGIADSKDECPRSPVGTHVNAKGCPKIADADNDEVADANDLCPNTESGATVNEFGCTAAENITLEGVNFATGSARLTLNSQPILAAAAETLKKAPTLNVEISGYTDNLGSARLNKNLSQRRANTVMIQLIKNGVVAKNLSAKGYGEANPVATNDTEKGRATNRRVELKIR